MMSGKKTFIVAFNEKDKEYLLSLGYKCISSDKNGDDTLYTFLNDGNKATFSENDRGRFLFTNILNF